VGDRFGEIVAAGHAPSLPVALAAVTVVALAYGLHNGRKPKAALLEPGPLVAGHHYEAVSDSAAPSSAPSARSTEQAMQVNVGVSRSV
jgi:hypothetical protein